MEGSFVEECVDLSRLEADRVLRSYKKMNSIIKSSCSYGRHFGYDDDVDQTVLQAQMYYIRSLILSVEDARERMLLYHYYVKGSTLNICAKLLGVSMRTVCRIKSSALSSFYLLMKSKKDE